ncbi:MAG: ATP-binding protein, partial [Candidatus Micrarchaeota archaeon]
TMEGPTTFEFSFVVNAKNEVRKNEFVQLNSTDGLLVGSVRELLSANRYFERAESISEYEKAGNSFSEQFPAGDWEYSVARCVVLGVLEGGVLKRCAFPPAPGTKVLKAEPTIVREIAGFVPDGLAFGSLLAQEIPVQIGLTRLLQKHFALLGMSGSGKSHAAAVLLEELLLRKKEFGRMGIVVFDAHGDYTGFADSRGEFGAHTKVIVGNEIRIGSHHLNASLLKELLPEVTASGLRDFSKIMQKFLLERGGNAFELSELIEAVQKDDLKETVKAPLLSWMEELEEIDLFGRADSPDLKQLVKPGKMIVFDLSDVDSLKKKQAIVAFFARKLFSLRRKKQVPPYLMLVEEAHNFAQEKAAKGSALSKSIIETIAREGRKFGACLALVSQRPVQLSTTALSQCNSFLVMRVTNPYDVDRIAESCEGIDRAAQNQITSLRVGEGILLGEAVNFPLFLQVRQRRSSKAGKGKPLEEQAKEFEESAATSHEGDEKAFL